MEWNSGVTGTITAGDTIACGTLYVEPTVYYPSVSASSNFGFCQIKEGKNMKLYKVFFVRIDNRDIIEVNVAARNESDAFIKAFLSQQIPVDAIDDFDKHAQFICNLTEDNE